jgi:excisionase family DNA binding protein
MSINDSQLYRVSEACRILAVSKSTLYALIARGIVPCCRIGEGTVRISGRQLTAFIQSFENENAAQAGERVAAFCKEGPDRSRFPSP